MLTRRQSLAHRRLLSISSISLSFSSSTDISIYILREIFLVLGRKAACRQHTHTWHRAPSPTPSGHRADSVGALTHSCGTAPASAGATVGQPPSLHQAVEPSDAAHVGQPFTAPAGACCAVADPRKRPVWRHAAMGGAPSASVGMGSIRGEIRV
jgi:hypothetical protein